MRLNEAKEVFQDLDYPVTTAELVEELGILEIELPMGTETVSRVFERVGTDTYRNPEEACLMFMSGLGSKAIGRKGYSDRDPPVTGSGNPLLGEESRFEAEGPHCGICRHVEFVGDWHINAYCNHHDDIVEPILNQVCPAYHGEGWSYTQPSD